MNSDLVRRGKGGCSKVDPTLLRPHAKHACPPHCPSTAPPAPVLTDPGSLELDDRWSAATSTPLSVDDVRWCCCRGASPCSENNHGRPRLEHFQLVQGRAFLFRQKNAHENLYRWVELTVYLCGHQYPEGNLTTSWTHILKREFLRMWISNLCVCVCVCVCVCACARTIRISVSPSFGFLLQTVSSPPSDLQIIRHDLLTPPDQTSASSEARTST